MMTVSRDKLSLPAWHIVNRYKTSDINFHKTLILIADKNVIRPAWHLAFLDKMGGNIFLLKYLVDLFDPTA